MEIIGEHNEICKEIAFFNKFCDFHLLIDAIIYSSQLAFMLFISFFTNIVDFLKFTFPSFSLSIFICYFAIYGIASIFNISYTLALANISINPYQRGSGGAHKTKPVLNVLKRNLNVCFFKSKIFSQYFSRITSCFIILVSFFVSIY